MGKRRMSLRETRHWESLLSMVGTLKWKEFGVLHSTEKEKVSDNKCVYNRGRQVINAIGLTFNKYSGKDWNRA